MTRANNKLDASSSLASGDDDGAVCYLCLDGGDDDAGSAVAAATVLVEAVMRDLSTFRALLIMQQPKVSRLVACRNSLRRG
jgi:hypothetical protein